MLSIGGDGTLLDTVNVIRDSGMPVLGINMGRLGFLSSVNKNFINEAMQMLLNGKYRLDNRSMLAVKTPCDHFDIFNIALNEVSIQHYGNPCLISIRVYVDGVFMNTFWADGLIISTPTGSTGYSLSCGGPIIAPHCNNFVITPVATHNLTVRPVVIPDNGEIKLKVEARTGKYIVGLDARYEVLETSVDLILKKSTFMFNLVLLENEDFFSTIRDKLNWGIDSRN
jgi:NAD+ kinase